MKNEVRILQFMIKLFWVVMFAVFYYGHFSEGVNSTLSARPAVVNIGCILTMRSNVGKITKLAIETAVEDVNSNPDVLGGTKLKTNTFDSNSNELLGIVQAIRYMETETVAIIGPQSSVIAHVISHIANEIHVPLLSFSATDPALTPLQYPFFIRTSPNDRFQMAAIASIIAYYEWRDVIAIYADDEYGRSGIAALEYQLVMRRCKISYKAPLKTHATMDEVGGALAQVALKESRIIVVHTYPYRGLDIFSVAKNLGMKENGYVWIATHWLSTIFDTVGPLSSDKMDNLQGVITLRAYTPDSEVKRNFISRWSNLSRRIGTDIPLGMCTYGLYAYDTVWLLAHALSAFFKKGGKVSFSINPRFHIGGLNLHSVNIFDGGKLLLDNVLKTKITGVTGPYEFTSERELNSPSFEVINVIGTGVRKVGYWSNFSGLSIVPPDSLHSKPPNQKLSLVFWPGETTQKPRGWVFPNNGLLLKVGVPNRAAFHEFVEQEPGTGTFKGYSIDVFTSALSVLPYAVPYEFVPFGNGHDIPDDAELISLITKGVYDAAVGDIAIITNRTELVDFTQPYIESGLVVVAPFREMGSSAWAFLEPFTPHMWFIIGMFLLITGAAVWILEHRNNDEFRGPPGKHIINILWFGILTFFSANREKPVSTFGRLVFMIWVFAVLIINNSYTASLSSILTVQHLSSIKGIESLLTTNDPIGYQNASFVRNYLVEELRINESRLVPFHVPEDYAKALRDGPNNGGVAAVIDEKAYMELFLSTHCEFGIVGPELRTNGWGFAFQKDSPLAVDMSTAIMKLSENGELQRIHEKWLLRKACTSQYAKPEVHRLQLKSFLGLFLMCGFACILALLMYLILLIRQFRQYCSEHKPSSSETSQSPKLQTFLSFVCEKES